MNSTRVICCLFLACGGLLVAKCGGPTQTTGNSSQTPNAVVGTLFGPDGHTPAAGVAVHIRSKKTLADTAGLALAKKLAVLAATDSVVTDSAGQYAFDTTLDTGTYVIEATNGNNAALIDSVAVKTKTTTDTLAPDTLKPAGALKGVIKLSEGGDPRKVFVLAFGIDRFARVNADGSFKFSNLAEAKYDLRLISSLDNYGVLDTNAIPVISADTTNLDTISLPFTGIPTPKNVTIAYDTLKQIVTLNWNKADPTLVTGYYVYRRNVDSNTVLTRINTSPITDTLYRDSTGIQDQTYEYRVSAIDKNATEGTKSAGVSIIIAVPFTFSFSFGSQGTTGSFINQHGICFGHDSLILIADKQNSMIKVFDTAGVFLYQFSDSSQVWDIAVSDSGYVFTTDVDFSRIKEFDLQGHFLKSWEIPTTREGNNAHITVFDTILYVTYVYSSEVTLYSTHGDSLGGFILPTAVNGFGYGGWDITTDSKGQIFIPVNDTVFIYNKQGVLLKQFVLIPEISVDSRAIAVDSNGRIFVCILDLNLVYVYDTNGNYLAKFGGTGSTNGKFQFFSSITIDAFNNIYISDGDLGKIQKFVILK
jgi:hypothetical protein